MSNDLTEASLAAWAETVRAASLHSPLYIKHLRVPFDPRRHTDPASVSAVLLSLVANQYEHYNRGHRDDVTPHSTWAQLGFDSLDRLDLAMAIEDTFDLELSDEDAETLLSIPLATSFITSRLSGRAGV